MTKKKTKTDASKWTVAEKRSELWRRGILHWKLHSTQLEMYNAIMANTKKKFVINCSRRLGKSFLMCIIALEHAIQNPRSQIKMAAPSQKAITRIITPLMRDILQDCPKHLQPRYKLHDSTWVFPNGSQIDMAGSEQNQADRLRGTACDFFVCDEAAFCSDLAYLVESIISPQMLTRPNARTILASTPPVTPDHPFVSKYMKIAIAQGAYLHRTIYDNPMLTPDTIEEYMIEAGGEDSTTWKREYLAQVVTETEDALLPEASEQDIMSEVITEIRRPVHYLPFTAMDLGYLDYTGVLFGYYHFPAGKLVIEDEILVNKMTSAQIVAAVLEKERELWGENIPRGRVVDGNALAIADMNETHRFNCRVPDKSDLAANINRIRMDLKSRTLLIDPRCTNLISQVQFATWDKARTKFSRSSSGGHWDLIAALMYWCKHVDRISNPMPADFGYSMYDDWGFPRERKNSVGNQLKALFPFICPPRKRFK